MFEFKYVQLCKGGGSAPNLDSHAFISRISPWIWLGTFLHLIMHLKGIVNLLQEMYCIFEHFSVVHEPPEILL